MKSLALPLLLMLSNAAAAQPTIVEGSFTSEHGTRSYRLALPAGHQPSQRRPMVVMLHGCLQDAADIARGSQLDVKGTGAGMIVLYPEQPETANVRKCWNWFDAAHQQRDRGEPALLAGMIRQVAAERGADPARIYIGGISAGGAMAAITAAAYPELFAAVASHAGIAVGASTTLMGALQAMGGNAPELPPIAERMRPHRALPMPLLVTQGGADKSVNARNAQQLVRQWLGRAVEPASSEERTSEGGYHWLHERWPATAETPRVEAALVRELGHALSGGSKDGTFTDPAGPDVIALMLEFFRDVSTPREGTR